MNASSDLESDIPKRKISYVQPRIVGGSGVPKGSYPWFARQLTQKSDGLYNWGGCAGVLILGEWILTAAHCVNTEVNTPHVIAYDIGALCPTFENNCYQMQELKKATQIFIHPRFDSPSFNYDFALVRLDSKSRLPRLRMDKSNVSKTYDSSTNLTVVGFGMKKYYDEDSYPNRLQHTEVNYITNRACKNKGYHKSLIDSSMMCALGDGKDACIGDSGGPLVDLKRDLLVGLVSWGYGCADKNYPGIYSRVARAKKWIRRIVCKNSSTPPPLCRNI